MVVDFQGIDIDPHVRYDFFRILEGPRAMDCRKRFFKMIGKCFLESGNPRVL